MIRPGPEKHGVWPNLSLDNALLILGGRESKPTHKNSLRVTLTRRLLACPVYSSLPSRRLAVSTASYETRQDAKTSKAVPFYETLPGNHSSTDPPLTSPHTASSPRTRTASATIIPLGTHTFSDGQGRGSFPLATHASLPLLIPNRDAISISLRIDCKT